jgi:hypothetical protein
MSVPTYPVSNPGGAARRDDRRRVHHLDSRKVPTLYILFMAVWIYGFAAVDRSLPALVMFALLMAGAGAQVAVGYGIGRWEALGLAAVPVILAVAAAGFDSNLWTTIVILMVFPGAPLIGLGVYLRHGFDERTDRSPDAWLYGEDSGA